MILFGSRKGKLNNRWESGEIYGLRIISSRRFQSKNKDWKPLKIHVREWLIFNGGGFYKYEGVFIYEESEEK